MPFRPMMLRGTRVLARCDESGELIASPEGRVEIRYKAQDPRAYQAHKRNLEPAGDDVLVPDDAVAAGQEVEKSSPSAKKAAAARTAESLTHAPDAIVIYADGACSGNPGPAGVGVVLQDGKTRRELSLYLGEGTNNIAELTGVLEAANAIAEPTRPVRIHTDSKYAIGVLTQGWKAKANVELVTSVRAALARLSDCKLIHVPGHAGVVLNERADALAVLAVRERRSTGWITY